MNRDELIVAFEKVRSTTEALCQPLETEDYVIQTMTDVSPPKWHLGHTTWFFEQVILQQFSKNYRPFVDKYYFVFNSYYQSFGERVSRDIRGTLSRPTVREVYGYRSAVNDRVRSLIESVDAATYTNLMPLVVLGLHHEQQHQELLLTDIKHIFAKNPLEPTYHTRNGEKQKRGKVPAMKFREIEGGIFEIGASNGVFAWDNERPKHKVFINEFALMDRLITNGEYLDFINDNGYRNPLLWLSDGWDWVTREDWGAPLYWEKVDGSWEIHTLSGQRPLDPNEPATHISYYEAQAFARWADKRLPTEQEWERAAATVKTDPSCGNFQDEKIFHPVPLGQAAGVDTSGLSQMFGDVWEWTQSAYLPYPGYKQERGPLGEYNGKFMSNQMVLRGGSCATPRSHIRPTYRNFFQPEKRWQFTGLRLATDKP